MIQKLKFPKVLITLSALLLVSAVPAMAGKDSLYMPKVEEVMIQDDGSLKITYSTMAESMWYCPGAIGKATEKGLELSFLRSHFKKKPKVDYKAMPVKDSIARTIVIPATKGTVLVNDGKKLVQIYPKDKE